MQLADSLKVLARHLDAIDAPFAVIGGLAASARGEARFTRDIDLAVSVATGTTGHSRRPRGSDPEAES
jgi:predicted nucleotidyltransferase